MKHNVDIEIRAAELYAMGSDAFLHFKLSEMRGWFDYSFDIGPPDGPFAHVPTFGDIAGWYAGWLARHMTENC